MAGQSDFVLFNPSAVTLSTTAEACVLEYTPPADTPLDCILQSFSHGTPDSTPEKVIWRIYKGASAVTGSPTTITSTGIADTGRGTTGSTGTLKTGGTLPSLSGINPVFRELINQASGYTNPQTIGLAAGETLLVTAQLSATDGNTNCFARLVMRNPAYGG